jgi:hypothetical protein
MVSIITFLGASSKGKQDALISFLSKEILYKPLHFQVRRPVEFNLKSS